MKKIRKINLPVMQRAATFEPKSIDVEKRTVDVIFTKGARVLRRGFFSDDFFEELSLDKKAVRMKRLESGTAPVLDTHGFSSRSGVESVLGVVESAEIIPGKEGRATLRFSDRADVQPVFKDIQDGILRNISVGYNTFKTENVGEVDGTPIFRAIDWEPMEISVVPAGADPSAQIRSDKNQMTECIFIENEKENLEIDTPETVKRNEPSKEKVVETENLRQTQSIEETDMTKEEMEKAAELARQEATANEKTRAKEIRSIVKKVGLDAKFADEYIDGDKTIDEVRTLAIDLLAEKANDPKTETRAANIDASVGEDLARKGRIEGMTSALLHRFRPKDIETRDKGQLVKLHGHELAESGRQYAYLSLVDMARNCLEAQGIRTGMYPKHTIADMALNNVRSVHSITDFPEILANVTNKTLRNGYLAAPQTFMPFTNEVFVGDFKEISRTNLGDAPELLQVEEGSEVKRGSMSEAAEKYRVEEFARIVAISRKIILNDDLAAFTRIPERMGRRAADLESDLVWNIIKANANLADGVALFSVATHANLSGTPAAPDEAGLNEARASMRRKTGLDGAEISLTPAWIFVPPAHETATEKLIATTRPNNASDVNPFGPQGRTTLRMDVEPRLETGPDGSLTAWFVTADKGQVDMVELARLEGTDGPQIQSRDGFDIAGVEIKVMHDIGAKAIDFRGLFKNAGA